jgi:hypothetical protein
MLQAAFGDNALWRTRTFQWFARFRRGETSVEVVSMQVDPLQVAEMKTRRKFVKSPTKIDEVPFRKQLAG